MSVEATILLTVAVPLLGAVLIAVTGRAPNLRDTISVITAVILCALVASLYPAVGEAGPWPEVRLFAIVPGIDFGFAVEPLGLTFALVSSFLWIVTALYAIGYMRAHGEAHQTRFYVCFALALASAMGVAFAANMFTLFAFYEALTLSTYPLVTHSGTDEAKRAARTYLVLLLGTAVGFQLLAIIWTWVEAGTLEFVPWFARHAAGIFPPDTSKAVLTILLILYAYGIGKAALMPFHRWLPAAMVAPTPVSALLHAVAVVKAGVFTILKVVTYFYGGLRLAELSGTDIVMYVSAATIVIAALVAMRQDDLKLRLAYSTVSQLSYIVLGAMLGGLGTLGAGLHMATHAFGKITLFLCAGAILVASHTTKVSEMRGLARTMPFTMAAFVIGSLSIIGLPPFGGFWSKLRLIEAAAAGQHYVMIGVMILGSLLSAGYLLPVALRAFARDSSNAGTVTVRREAPVVCVAAIWISALGCLALFLWPEPILSLLGRSLPR